MPHNQIPISETDKINIPPDRPNLISIKNLQNKIACQCLTSSTCLDGGAVVTICNNGCRFHPSQAKIKVTFLVTFPVKGCFKGFFIRLYLAPAVGIEPTTNASYTTDVDFKSIISRVFISLRF